MTNARRIQFKRAPPRRAGETPPTYMIRTGWCPDDYTKRIAGCYWCNPAHCSRTWKKQSERDAHLAGAYAILD